jgi:type IV secretory pathway TrbL component
MAAPLPPRAGRPPTTRRSVRALLLAAALFTVVLGGLFVARPAIAAPAAKAATAATSAPAAAAAPAASAAKAAPAAQLAEGNRNALLAPDGGVCSVPVLGDLGGLVNLCNAGTSGVAGELNNICSPGLPEPEVATSGINSLITTPGAPTTGKTLYDNYGTAGQFWAATGLQCSSMTSLIGNNVAGMVFDMAKSLDRVTITVYQSAAGSNILTWLSSSVDTLISDLGNAIYFPFLAPVVIIGAIWLAWQGLIRKRATRTIEGTIWMVIACAAAIWLIGQPQDFTGVGTTVSNGVTSVLNTAFDKLPAGNDSNCLPVQTNDPQSVTANYAFDSGSGLVDQNANELWSVLVCKPWLEGEFGTTQYAQLGTPAAKNNLIDEYGRSLLYAQAFATNEQPTATLTQAKQQIYSGISADLQTQAPATYALFQGNQWTTRLEIAFFALFAAVAAGLLVLLIALTLIILKLGFLLLLVAGPFFLIVGVHPGFGRVVAIRWFEMLVGVLLKQVAVALVLSILLYCYSLIMGTTDQELPWGLKIMMISLVTVAVFIYRKPFQHLFSSVGYGMIGANERAEVSWRESAWGFRRVHATAAGTVMPGAAAAAAAAANAGASRASRWARRATDGVGGAADGTASGAADSGGVRATSSEGMSVMPTVDSHGSSRQWPAAGVGTGRTAPPLPLSTNGAPPSANGGPAGWARNGGANTGTGARGPAEPPARRTGPMPAAPTSAAPRSAAPAPPPVRRTGPAPTGSATQSPPPPAPTPPATPFWSRSRRRPQ